MKWIFLLAAGAAPNVPGQPALQVWDENLCVTAQTMVAGAGDGQFVIDVLYGEGDGFHTIQMNADEVSGVVTIATSANTVQRGGQQLRTDVACKMVNAERIRDVLALDLPGAPATCREVNAATHAVALESLTVAERSRYLAEGRQLSFAPDYITASGGEWLPARVVDFIAAEPGPAGTVRVTAPAVQVPWDPVAREFHQGTRHCKLLTAALMRTWMRDSAFRPNAVLLEPAGEVCSAPATGQAQAGSCRFWFAPAQAMFCQDYTGPGWNAATAREACARRHASEAALKAAGSGYEGSGGSYAAQSCAQRADSGELGGTCVFNCGTGEETTWRQSGAGRLPASAAATMLARACDLYIE